LANEPRFVPAAVKLTEPEEVLAETHEALQPLIPYLDTLRWVFIALALVGIAIAIYGRLDDWKRGR
jgi:hypothetical protein